MSTKVLTPLVARTLSRFPAPMCQERPPVTAERPSYSSETMSGTRSDATPPPSKVKIGGDQPHRVHLMESGNNLGEAEVFRRARPTDMRWANRRAEMIDRPVLPGRALGGSGRLRFVPPDYRARRRLQAGDAVEWPTDREQRVLVERPERTARARHLDTGAPRPAKTRDAPQCRAPRVQARSQVRRRRRDQRRDCPS